jgi:hypothetical protein
MKKPLNQNAVCVGCIALPGIGFGAGLLAIGSPIAVLYASLAVIGVGWIGALSWVIRADPRTANAAGGTGGALAILGTLFGLGAGLLAGGEGSFDLPVVLIAFTLGVVGGLIYRTRNKTGSGGEARSSWSREAASLG